MDRDTNQQRVDKTTEQEQEQHVEEKIHLWILGRLEIIKDEKPKCFNCNTFGYMANNFWKLKKEQDTRKCYKCDKIGHIAKNCQLGQKIKSCSIQEESNTKKNNKEQCFGEGSE